MGEFDTRKSCFISLAIITGALFAISCGSRDRRHEAEAAAASFHSLLNEGRFEQIVLIAGEDFQTAVPREKAMALFRKISRECGKFLSSTTVDRQSMEYGESGETRVSVLTLDATYVRGTLREQFFFRADPAIPAMVAFKHKGTCRLPKESTP